MAIGRGNPAYENYLATQRGFSIIARNSLNSAAGSFRDVVRDAPEFARGWGHLGYALAQTVVGGHLAEGEDPKSVLAEAEACARKAIELDPEDYANRWDLGFVLLNQGRREEALAEYDKALDFFDHRTDMLERRNDLLVEVAEAYVYDGNLARAFELLDRAVRIPDWYRWIRAWAFFNARNYQGAIDQINAMHKQFGDPAYVPDIQLLLAAAHAKNGNSTEAAAALARLRQGRPEWTLAKELARNPFANETDRQHWEEAMRAAGFA